MYAPEFLPQQYRSFFRLNPMLYVLNEFRMAIYYGQLPSARSITVSMVIGVGFLMLGYSYFRRSEDEFVYYV